MLPTRDDLKRFVLENSKNRMDDLVRNGLINPDFHAMANCCWYASRLTWDHAKQHVKNEVALGFILPSETELILSVLAEICPSVTINATQPNHNRRGIY